MAGLVTMTNADEVQGVKNFVIAHNTAGGHFQIGGRGIDGNWFYPEGQNFFIGKPDLFDTGCLVTEGYPWGFIVKVVPCTDTYWIICEFKYEIF
jgi:hypothetical protein